MVVSSANMDTLDFYRDILSKYFWNIGIQGHNGIEKQFFVSHYLVDKNSKIPNKHGLVNKKDIENNLDTYNNMIYINNGIEMNDTLKYYKDLFNSKINIPSRLQLDTTLQAIKYNNNFTRNFFVYKLYEVTSYNGSCLYRSTVNGGVIQDDNSIKNGFRMRLVYNP